MSGEVNTPYTLYRQNHASPWPPSEAFGEHAKNIGKTSKSCISAGPDPHSFHDFPHSFRKSIKTIGKTSKSCISAGRVVTFPRPCDGDATGARTGSYVDPMENNWKTKVSAWRWRDSCAHRLPTRIVPMVFRIVSEMPPTPLENKQILHFSKAGEVIINWGACRCLVDQPRSST